jgi:CBS domain-containing protein
MSANVDALPRVGSVCTPNFVTVPRRRRVVEVARVMAARWVSAVIVTEERRPVGMVTRRTLISDVLARGYTGMELTAGDVMHYPIMSVDADTGLAECISLMAESRLRHLAVVREDRLVGLLSDYQIARLIPRFVPEEPQAGAAPRGGEPGVCGERPPA